MGKRSVEVPNSGGIIHLLEGQVEKRSEDLRDRVTKYFPREKGNLREVGKNRVNPDGWLWKGHIGWIHKLRRRSPLEEIRVGEVKDPQARSI